MIILKWILKTGRQGVDGINLVQHREKWQALLDKMQ
jgi:hypothetical protein